MPESEPTAHCSYQGCSRDVHGDTGLCIFHAPADKKDPQEFRNALAKQIIDWRNAKATTWNFRGWVFVDGKNLKTTSLYRINRNTICSARLCFRLK
ncbi:hypothetical protein EHM69_00775 [candidate division KSB1 bacterium]|nr:MAG: hypothetical protein EHM69_00775 [candidate division KSB1 bacterium]